MGLLGARRGVLRAPDALPRSARNTGMVTAGSNAAGGFANAGYSGSGRGWGGLAAHSQGL